eukprot:GFYU01014203.1.p1 GENE.GFYU01014203.1~~GFYU01014203.1.p1  ORF type:complete len:424 (-),score=90.29 GFYU01014203.1:218-1489(-)
MNLPKDDIVVDKSSAEDSDSVASSTHNAKLSQELLKQTGASTSSSQLLRSQSDQSMSTLSTATGLVDDDDAGVRNTHQLRRTYSMKDVTAWDTVDSLHHYDELVKELVTWSYSLDLGFAREWYERTTSEEIPVHDTEYELMRQSDDEFLHGNGYYQHILRSHFAIVGPSTQWLQVQVALNHVHTCAFICNAFQALHPQQLEELKSKMTSQGKRLMDEPNAGGNSVNSEALSFEVLEACFRATILRTEMEVKYKTPDSKKIDYTCEMMEYTIGVSVTRAMKYKGPFTEEDARYLYTKKLTGLHSARKTVSSRDRWDKQVLHIWAVSKEIACTLETVFRELPRELKAEVLVIVTVSKNIDHIVFQNALHFDEVEYHADRDKQAKKLYRIQQQMEYQNLCPKTPPVQSRGSCGPPAVSDRLKYFFT